MTMIRWGALQQHFCKCGVQTVPPITADEVEGFENGHHVALPQDLRSFYITLGGMDLLTFPACDQNGFAIWPLSAVERFVFDPGLFLIADYFNWSWAYTIRLWHAPAYSNPILLLDGAEPQTIAESFTQFIDLVLSDSPLLYPH
ncbi:SMI1/KNR4 family protein [Nocardia xishanensis]|uniref:SMI1/KNR4 family protein n=1 Tax=Nocardia xishanensis TaxID=238964 RepID=A0ABW7WYF9_9NOCA